MDAILTAIRQYTNHSITTDELTADADPWRSTLAHAVERAASAVVRIDDELGQVAGWVTDKTDRVRAALAAHPGQPLPTLNPLGELQAHAPRFDALISERAARIEHLQAVVALWVAQPTPPAPAPPTTIGVRRADWAAEATATNVEE
jgi:hypothetical protein